MLLLVLDALIRDGSDRIVLTLPRSKLTLYGAIVILSGLALTGTRTRTANVNIKINLVFIKVHLALS